MAAAVPSLGATFGALYIGSILSSVGWGFTTNQAFVYFKTYGREDSVSTQISVLGLWILDTFQVALLMHMSWHYIIAGLQDHTLLSRLVWSFSLEWGVTVTVTFIVRAIYIKQLWRLSEKKMWLLGPAFLLAVGQLGLGLQTSIHMLRHPHVRILTTIEVQWILGTKCVSSVLADLVITSATCYFLHAARTGYKKTNDLVNSLLLYTVSRGVFAFLMETAVMITFLTMKTNFIFAALQLMLGKLHTSSLFALLLHRDTLRARQDLETTPMQIHTFSRLSVICQPETDTDTDTDTAMVTRQAIVERERVEDQVVMGEDEQTGQHGRRRCPHNSDPIVW